MAAGLVSRSESMDKLRELIKGIKVAMFTTADEDGTLRSRPMVTQETDFDGDLQNPIRKSGTNNPMPHLRGQIVLFPLK
jgi:general stress protein 26